MAGNSSHRQDTPNIHTYSTCINPPAPFSFNLPSLPTSLDLSVLLFLLPFLLPSLPPSLPLSSSLSLPPSFLLSFSPSLLPSLSPSFPPSFSQYQFNPGTGLFRHPDFHQDHERKWLSSLTYTMGLPSSSPKSIPPSQNYKVLVYQYNN